MHKMFAHGIWHPGKTCKSKAHWSRAFKDASERHVCPQSAIQVISFLSWFWYCCYSVKIWHAHRKMYFFFLHISHVILSQMLALLCTLNSFTESLVQMQPLFPATDKRWNLAGFLLKSLLRKSLRNSACELTTCLETTNVQVCQATSFMLNIPIMQLSCTVLTNQQQIIEN